MIWVGGQRKKKKTEERGKKTKPFMPTKGGKEDSGTLPLQVVSRRATHKGLNLETKI